MLLQASQSVVRFPDWYLVHPNSLSSGPKLEASEDVLMSKLSDAERLWWNTLLDDDDLYLIIS